MKSSIFTVGHSTRSFDEFLGLLRHNGMACLVDVRTAPTSRRLPHFSKEALERSLSEQEIAYLHMKELGGWRRPRRNSPNPGWRVRGFQGYADHMQTDEFEAALERLESAAAERRTTLMCAEALWWRCHRQLISDALVVRGWRVRHIGAGRASDDHQLTSFAVVEGDRITYPPAQETLA